MKIEYDGVEFIDLGNTHILPNIREDFLPNMMEYMYGGFSSGAWIWNRPEYWLSHIKEIRMNESVALGLHK